MTEARDVVSLKEFLEMRFNNLERRIADLCGTLDWCTILFIAFLMDKIVTMTMKGGNTDELYQGDGRLRMALSLQRQHPDVVKVTRKWGRWQHQVDYRSFKGNKLIRKEGVEIPQGINEYGMKLVKVGPVPEAGGIG